MQAEDRPIHFSVELIHPPVDRPVAVLQQLYFELSRTPRAAYENTNFAQPGPPRFFSMRGRHAQSIIVFPPDRIAIIEEWCDQPLSSFVERMLEVSARHAAAFGVTTYLAQTVTMRTTFALTNFSDARAFLLDGVCGQQGRVAEFMGRPIGAGGIRLVLPETEDNPAQLHILIESFKQSIHEVFVEAKAVYPGRPIQSGDDDALRENVLHVRDFINRRVYPFLNQYDIPTAQVD